jgi:NADH-quinone oxidoreductase subunit J
MELFVFVASTAMVLIGAIGVVTRRHPVHAAMSLVLTLFGIAVMFVAMEAHYLAAVQVIVYAGAIVVLFLFVIMLLGVDRSEDLSIEPFPIQRYLAAIVGAGLLVFLGAAIIAGRDSAISRGGGLPESTLEEPDANLIELSRSVFGDYVVAFEVTSVLLVVAVVGTVVLARRPSRRGPVASREDIENEVAR